MPKIPLQVQDGMKNKLQTFVKTFEEPEFDENGKPLGKMKGNMESNDPLGEGEGQQNEDEEDINELKAQLPLGEGVLKVNLGIPIIVICTKIDLMMRGDKAQYLETNIDFIQKHLREYCLSYAASLVFTETLQMTNIELLYRYIIHRLYDYEFMIKSQVYAKD